MREREKYCTAGQTADDSILRRMRIACWITKATGTHSEYVILTACPRQLSLRESTSLLRPYVPCLSYLIKLYIHFSALSCLNLIHLTCSPY